MMQSRLLWFVFGFLFASLFWLFFAYYADMKLAETLLMNR